MTKEKIKFIPLTNNLILKKLFYQNKDILKEMLISILKLNINPNNTTIKIVDIFNNNPPYLKDNIFIKNLTNYNITTQIINILISIDQDIKLNIELKSNIINNHILIDNTKINKMIPSNNNPKTITLYYLYYLNFKLSKIIEDNVEEEYSLNLKSIGTINIIHKYLPYFYNLYYLKKDKLTKDKLWLALLSSKNIIELEKISNHLISKNQTKTFINNIKNLYNDNLVYTNLILEKISNINNYEYEQELKEKSYQEGFDQGYNDGVEEGYKEGLKQKNKEDNYLYKD